jgi:hypothetical protein
MTRYINLCRDTPKKQDEGLTKYEKYKDSYKFYEEGRKEYHEKYNKMYREKHSGYIDCECGTTYKILSSYSHVKSQKHIAYSQKQNSTE